jgi:hypothetical protein
MKNSFKILKIWLVKCNNLRKLDFNLDSKIKDNLRNVKHYNPISIKKYEDNKNLCFILRHKL